MRPDEVKFRNANGVGLKLSNFLALDNTYHGKGMQSYSQLDKKGFAEFEFNTEKLHRLANHIRKIAADPVLPNKLYLIPEEEEEGEIYEVQEGAVIYKLHKFRERDNEIVSRKKILFLKEMVNYFAKPVNLILMLPTVNWDLSILNAITVPL